MELEVRALASGSSGNAFLIRTSAPGARALLLDAGLSARALERLLCRYNVLPGDLAALIITHEHHDHARGALPLARRYGAPLVCTPGTAAALGAALAGVEVRRLHSDGVSIGALDLWSFPVPHDAAEPCGLVLRCGRLTVGLALDLGHAPAHVAEALRQADLVIVEANHDREKLLAAPYPWSTKHRIMGERGHLSNLQAAQLLAAIAADGRPRDVWLAHLSEQANEHPQSVLRHVANALDLLGISWLRLDVAQRDRPSAVWAGGQALHQSSLLDLF
ncbi:MBL fold metallo-hydrolase [Kallotenue papyrolyticum]|uniref:MBL fold metallo-hydrolase n=1 Tax=Kallotenue papyrolyticum TaxID=1325125 RepID=UPI00047864B6|nr:MBL fold metallo-hydrolase [Kallotenue papyrolyticum]